jgi:hypothetical protein
MTTKKEPLMSKFKGKNKERYVMLRYWLLNSLAWRSLTGNARALYVEIARRYNGSNNGRISYSTREAGRSLHVSLCTAGRLLRILQDRGFIVCTKRGAFSLKTTKDASEWALMEYDCDHPPAHATKDFMRWQPEGVDIDTLNRGPSHHRKSRTRIPQRHRTDTPMTPHGYPHDTVKSKKRRNGYPHDTVEAQNVLSTDTPMTHLQLPGRGREPGVRDLPSFLEGEPAEKKPWSTPTVEEIPWDTLPTEVRMLVLGLPDAGLPPQVDAVADVPDQAEKAPPAADVVDEAEKAKREAAAEAPPAPPDQPVSTPEPVPATENSLPPRPKGMPEGDYQRMLRVARNREALARFDAAMKGRPLH